MKITETKIRKIIEKHLPEYSDVKIIVSQCYSLFSVNPINKIMSCPSYFKNKTKGCSGLLTVTAYIFHEIGHIATIKVFPKNNDELTKAEGDAQKWAIEKAIELKQIELAKCLLVNFANWRTANIDKYRGQLNNLYGDCNPYQIASIENEKWIEEKISLIAA